MLVRNEMPSIHLDKSYLTLGPALWTLKRNQILEAGIWHQIKGSYA